MSGGNVTDTLAQERKAACEVMRLQRKLKAEDKLKYTGDYVYEKVSWRDTDRGMDAATGKLGEFGKKGNHDLRRMQIGESGKHVEQFVYRMSSRDAAYFPVPAKYINLMMVDEDGTTRMKNPDGSKCTIVDMLKNFGRFTKHSSDDPILADLSIPGGDDEIVMLSLSFGFSVTDDITDEDKAQLEYYTAMSYSACTGADAAWSMWGSFGISCGVVQTNCYGEKIKLCPTAVVDGVEHQFHIAVTPTPRKTHQVGTESYEEKVRLTKKRMAIELPIGVEGITESMNTSFFGFWPIKKMAPVVSPQTNRSMESLVSPLDYSDDEMDGGVKYCSLSSGSMYRGCKYRGCARDPPATKPTAVDELVEDADQAPGRAPTNIYVCRQSLDTAPCGKAPKIFGSVKRDPQGRPVVDQIFNMMLENGKLPTEQDLLDFDALVGKVHKAVEALTGKKEHKLSDAYSLMIGATSTDPLPAATEMEIAATKTAITAPMIGIPTDLF